MLGNSSFIFLHYPLSILKHFHLPDIHTFKREKNIDMKALDFGFWEFFAVESVLFPEGEMDPDFPFVEVDVRKGGRGRWSRVEPESELAHEYLAVFIVADHPIEFLEFLGKLIRWKDSSVSDFYRKWLADTDTEIVPGIGIDEAFSVYTAEIERFSQYFTNRECPSFMLCLRVIARISEHSVNLAENKLGTVGRDKSGFRTIGKEFRENLE